MSYSSKYFQRAKLHMPGGVNSPVRAFKAVGGNPIFFSRGEGAYLFDVDGKSYIDYVCSWGAILLGHAYPPLIKNLKETISQGLSFGAPTLLEILLAEKIVELMPSIEMVRMVNSGTEAVMSAIRLARGYTGRNKILKFIGCYHGHVDMLLVEAGSGSSTLGIPNSAGVPPHMIEDTLLADFNNLAQVTELFLRYGKEIAGVIIEPLAGNMNFIFPVKGFLEGIRNLCDEYGSVLIFDEVMTGFRVGLGGAQKIFAVKPDLTTLGKVIGGGMPVGALGGRRAIMECLSPLGKVYQAGTLSGNPIAMAAGLLTLSVISENSFYEQLSAMTGKLMKGLQMRANHAGVPFKVDYLGGLFGFFFTYQKHPECFQETQACDETLFNQFFHGMLAEGIYLAPSRFEAGFISSSHSEKEIEITLLAAEKVFHQLASSIAGERE